MDKQINFDNNTVYILAEDERMITANRYYALRRYFARCLDYFLLPMVVSFFLSILLFLVLIILAFSGYVDMEFFNLKHHEQNPILVLLGFFTFSFLSLILSFFLEASLISQLETTPGKWLFGIKVIDSDNIPLSFSRALKRSVLVFIKGLALNIPIITTLALICGYRKLVKTGSTSWDKSVGSVVIYKKLGSVQKTICIAASILIFLSNYAYIFWFIAITLAPRY